MKRSDVITIIEEIIRKYSSCDDEGYNEKFETIELGKSEKDVATLILDAVEYAGMQPKPMLIEIPPEDGECFGKHIMKYGWEEE